MWWHNDGKEPSARKIRQIVDRMWGWETLASMGRRLCGLGRTRPYHGCFGATSFSGPKRLHSNSWVVHVGSQKWKECCKISKPTSLFHTLQPILAKCTALTPSNFDNTGAPTKRQSFQTHCFLFNMFPVLPVGMGRAPGSERPRPLHREARTLGQDSPWKHAWKSVPEQDNLKVLRVFLVQETFNPLFQPNFREGTPYNNLKLWSLCSAIMSTNLSGCPVLSHASRSKWHFFVELFGHFFS